MRTLTVATETALGQVVTQPGFLVELELDTPLRLASRGDVADAIGASWTGWHVVVTGLGLTANRAGVAGTVVLGDHDLSISAALLNVSAGFPVRVWKYAFEALAEEASDAVQIFDGISGEYSWSLADRAVTLQLLARETSALFVPRRYMTPETGYHALPPAGKIYQFNGQKYTLEQET